MGIDRYGLVGGVDRGVYVRHNPWHAASNTENKLITDGPVTIREAVEFAFPFEVKAVPLNEVYFAPGADEHTVLTRSDNGFVLSVNSASYGVVQPQVLADLGEALQLADPTFGEGKNKLNVFSLHNGKRTVLYMERDETSTLGGGDVKLQRGIAIINSYDGSYALSAKPVSWVVECMNTMPSAHAFNVASLKHTRGVMDYVPMMTSALVQAYTNWNALDMEIESLLSQSYSRFEYTHELVPAVIGERPAETGRGQTMYDERFATIVGQWGATGQEAAVGSKWGALMAVNSFELWNAKVKGDRTERQITKFMGNDFPLTKKAQRILVDA
jgi:hypothetical protein